MLSINSESGHFGLEFTIASRSMPAEQFNRCFMGNLVSGSLDNFLFWFGFYLFLNVRFWFFIESSILYLGCTSAFVVHARIGGELQCADIFVKKN